ncbi:RNA polymerase sigma-70 factor [Parapedobacter pyrenivorans]|uniref:RNA polymerase sigma-70 factor n=1 Tax=Parapedobacter pyrenivorans TaxID=1305674 RepID=UPI003340E97C
MREKPMKMANDSDDKRLVTALKNGDNDAFEVVYKRMASKLLHYVNSRVYDRALSEEIVQEIFVSLWGRRHKLDADMALEPYLFGAAKYQILSHIRSEKVHHKYAEHFVWFVVQEQENSTEDIVNEADLKAVIEEQISHLPPKCQRAFRLSRFEYLSITEIAEEMGISKRTVENYITHALKHLRQVLSTNQWLQAIVWFYLY